MVAAKIQAERSDPEPPTSAPTGWPQRWQKRAWEPREARQRTQLLGSRLAPQALQNFPEAEAPQAGQTAAVGEAVMWEGSVNPAAAGR
jgi:hypothetical protein